jgi:hypothetical protein
MPVKQPQRRALSVSRPVCGLLRRRARTAVILGASGRACTLTTPERDVLGRVARRGRRAAQPSSRRRPAHAAACTPPRSKDHNKGTRVNTPRNGG